MSDVFLMPSSMPQPGVYKTWVSGAACTGQKPAFFNSELLNGAATAGVNATLTIYLRLHLVKRNIKDNITIYDDDGKKVELRDWDDDADEFGRFKKGVKEQAERFWDNTKFCLLPPQDYRGLDYPEKNPKFRPNIDCHFKVVWASGPTDAHAVVDCFCPVKPAVFRSNAGGSDDGNGRGQWTCFDLDLRGGSFVEGTCMREVGDPLGEMEWKAVRCNKELAQETVCHEIGHFLGMSHVGVFFNAPKCVEEMNKPSGKGQNAPPCYHGRNDTDYKNIMGGGMDLASWNVAPWASRIVSHTGVSLIGWRVASNGVPAKRL